MEKRPLANEPRLKLAPFKAIKLEFEPLADIERKKSMIPHFTKI
jgi:hypothetical protein